MRAEAGLALLLAAGGCAREAEPATPDPAAVDLLAEVLLAESRAAAEGTDADSARAAALAAHGAGEDDLAATLREAAARPADGDALWAAVAQRLEAERLSGRR